MSRVFTLEELESLGFKEVRPGVFKKINTVQESSKKKNSIAPKHAGKYEVAGRVFYFRSGWEYIYAQWLEHLKKSGEIKHWDYEVKVFKFPLTKGTVEYKPDFIVLNSDDSHEWHEVKGYMDPKSATKIRRFAKFYPEEKLVLIRKKDIKAIEKSGLVKIPWH